MDIARPSHLQPLLDSAIAATALIAASFKTLFYKNWSFLR
jgi:beta-hydroxylase